MKKDYKRIILSVVIGLAVSLVGFYFFLPAINIHAKEFWVFLAFMPLVFSIPYISFKSFKPFNIKDGNGANFRFHTKPSKKFSVFLIATAVPVVVIMLGSLLSSPFFFAKKYASVIEVKDAVFKDDMPESKEVTNIALMDSQSAAMLGNRTLGALSEVVSQYDVSSQYTQINYKGAPKKVTNLEYDNLFKWLSNKKNGIPGMVMVDPVNSDAEYVKFKTPMYYAHSAYLNQNLFRKLRFSYPTKIFHSITFEVDEAGNPYYIVSCAKPRVFMFGAMDINEVIIFNPCDGSSEIYDVEDVPMWVDIVYDGNLACRKYDWKGIYSGGYFNSIIGNVGCKRTTDDFGYIVLGDDVWYFTGVTSVTADKSNIGFILSNARTGEYKFYSVIGAEEHSAMAAAQGEVQEKGYVSSFPSLINVSGQATYIMVLKDSAGLVKLYALVNVENYSIVATGTTQAEAMSGYKKQLKQSNIDIGAETDKTVEVKVENVRIATVAEVSIVYITDENGNVYKGYLEADEELILIRTGDVIEVSYSSDDNESRIYVINEWKFKK